MSTSRIFCVSLFLSVPCLRASLAGAAATRVETYLHEQNTWKALQEAYDSGHLLLILQTCKLVLGKHTEAARGSWTPEARTSAHRRPSDDMSPHAIAGVYIAENCMKSADSALEHNPPTFSEDEKLESDLLRAAIALNVVSLIGPTANKPELRKKWLNASLDAYWSVLNLKRDIPFSFIQSDTLSTLLRIVALMDELGRSAEGAETIEWYRDVFVSQAFDPSSLHNRDQRSRDLIFRADMTLRLIDERRVKYDVYSYSP